MRRLFEKVFRETSNENHELVGMSLPSEISFREINKMTKRGFLAKKLYQFTGISQMHEDDLFYLSLTRLSFLDENNENLLFLHLSELMLNWDEHNEDILLQIHKLDLKNDIQNAMLKAYEIYKDELFIRHSTVNTPIVPKTNQTDDEKWEIYRDVMLAATQGRFLLINEYELSEYKKGNVFCEGTIKSRADIPECRNRAKESLESQELGKSQIMSWLLVLSEAITNTIKHAEEGKMILINDHEKNEIRFVIEDKGAGFNLKELPKMTLLAGYSTKKSMGQGFTLMMKMSKQVLLFTSPKGSTIILSFDATKEKERKFLNATG